MSEEERDSIIWWQNRFKAVERDNKRLKEIIKGMIDNEEKYNLEIIRLNNIIKEVREYIKTNCLISDTWEELENHQFIPIGRINFKSLSGKKIKELLEILEGGKHFNL